MFARIRHIVQSKHVLVALSITTIVAIIQMVVWKSIFPYPNFLPDSYSYIDAAMQKQSINKWPIGYSKFLSWLSFITRSHIVLAWLQYVLLLLATSYLLYTVWLLLRPGKLTFYAISLTLLFNPLTYQVSNLVSSDALFTALSLVWFSQLLQIINNPTIPLSIVHAITLALAFSVRFSAIYYPLISISVFLLSAAPKFTRLIGIGTSIIFIGAFIGYTQYHYKKETGWVQFSAFGGWQLASNALYAYSHVSQKERAILKYDVTELQQVTDRHMDSIQNSTHRPDNKLGVYYLWDAHSPLQQHMEQRWHEEKTITHFSQWAWMGIRYRKFGSWIIKNYSKPFIQYYLFPNLVNYYIPDPEFLGIYNMNTSKVDNKGVAWFKLRDNTANQRYSPNILQLNLSVGVIFSVCNLLFVISFLTVNFLLQASKRLKRVLRIAFTIWIINLGVSVFASPIVLRHQVFTMFITQVFTILALSYIINQCLVKRRGHIG